jgi:hypothetical protein
MSLMQFKDVTHYNMKIIKINMIRRVLIIFYLLCSFGCGAFHRSPDATLPAATSAAPSTPVEIKPTQGRFMLSDSVPVYAQPDKASVVIAYVPSGTHVNVAKVEGDWLLIRLPNGKVGFIPSGAAE